MQNNIYKFRWERDFFFWYEKNIRFTLKNEHIKEESLKLSDLSDKVCVKGRFVYKKVLITSRALKHMYDKRSAEEFYFVVSNFGILLKKPNLILFNKSGKRGTKCLVSTKESQLLFLILEESYEDTCNYVVSAFRIKKEYLKGYEVIHNSSWEGDNLHRN